MSHQPDPASVPADAPDGHIQAPPAGPRLPAAWAGALNEWTAHLEQSGRASSSAGLMIRQVRRFAAEGACGSPWDVTPLMVSTWLDQLDCSTGTRYTYRTSIRTFFRWAVSAGRMHVDPTLDVGGRLTKHEPPTLWRQPIREFTRHLAAAGAPGTTIKARNDQLVHAARTLGVDDPWAVSVDVLVEWMGSRGWSRETSRARRAALRAFYAWGVERGHLDVSPALGLPRVPPAPPMPRPAPEEAIWDALDAAAPRERLMVRLAAELGLRRAEVAGVRTDHLERDRSGWWLWVRGKGDKVRRLPIAEELADEIRTSPPGWLFPGRERGHLSPEYVGKRVAALLPAGLTMHTLRHRFATRAYGVRHDVLAVQRLLGHASPATTQRYVVVDDDYLRGTVDAMPVPGRSVVGARAQNEHHQTRRIA